MTVLFQHTISHDGRNPDIPDGGWTDSFVVGAVGTAGVFTISQVSQRGADVAPMFYDAGNPAGTWPYWVNMHVTTPVNGNTNPHPYATVASSGVLVYTRNLYEPYSVTITVSDVATPYCEYGTESNPEASVYTVITGALVDIVIAILGGGPLMLLAFDTLIGMPVMAYDCNSPPPAQPTITPDDFILGTGVPNPASLGKFIDLFRIGVWHFYCRCKAAPPGGTPPTPFPVPSDLPPSLTGGSQVPEPCDENDICATLNRLSRQIAALHATTNWYVTNTTQTNQTYNVNPPASQPVGDPVPATPGQVGTALGIHGITVTLTSVPSWTGQTASDPRAYFRAGWVHVGNDYGWHRGIPLHVSPQWIGFQPGDTRWGVALAPGFAADVQRYELKPAG
jgi:hypothetical protein